VPGEVRARRVWRNGSRHPRGEQRGAGTQQSFALLLGGSSDSISETVRDVSISVRRVSEDGYVAEVSPPHGDVEWKTEVPLPEDALMRRFEALNCHPRDAWDAVHEADQVWEKGA